MDNQQITTRSTRLLSAVRRTRAGETYNKRSMHLMKKILILLLVGTVLSLCAAGAPAAEKAELPPDVLGYALIPDPDGLLKDAGDFMGALSLPNAMVMIVRPLLGQLVENAALAGIDMSKPICFLAFQPDGELKPWAIGLTLDQPKAYGKVLEKNFPNRKEEEGVGIYIKETSGFDYAAYQQASDEEKQNPDDFETVEIKTIAVGITGNNAWFSDNPEAVKKLNPVAVTGLKPPVEGKIILVFEPATVIRLARQAYEEKKSLLEEKADESGSALSGKATDKLFQGYLDFYSDIGGQVDEVALGITIGAEGVTFQKWIRALPETGLALFLQEQKGGELELARLLDDGGWMVFDCRLDKPEMLIDPYVKMFDMFDGFFETAVRKENDKELVLSYLEAMKRTYVKSITSYLKIAGNEMAFSIDSDEKSLFRAASLVKIKDDQAFNKYIEDSFLESLKLIDPLYRELGINYDVAGVKEPGNYQGHQIYTAEITFDWEKLLNKEEMTDDQKKAFKLLQKPMIIQMAAAGKIGITEMAWGGKPEISALIDRIKKGGKGFDPNKFSPCGKDANGALYFSLDGFLGDCLLRIFKEMTPPGSNAGQTEVIAEMAKLDLPLLTCYRAQGREASITCRIPIEEIKAVKDLIEKMEAQAVEKPEPAR